MTRMRRLMIGGVAAGGAVVAAGALISALSDQIVIVDNHDQPVDDVTVYLTASSWGGCFCSFLHGGTQSPGNMTDGASQLAVLSEKHGLHFEPTLHWLARPLEVQKFTVGPVVDLPVTVWILSAGDTASKDIGFARDTLRYAKTGINLVWKLMDKTALNLKNVGCDDVGTLVTDRAFDETAVNIYYAEHGRCSYGGCPDVGGLSCVDRRVNFVYSVGSKNVLLHELGHAFLGASHWNPSTVGDDNIMRDSSALDRISITTGQAIVMNYDKRSVLNRLRCFNGIDCSLNCPRVEFDESWALCIPPTGSSRVPLTVVAAWFDCIDCMSGELERVVTRADEAIVTELSTPLGLAEGSLPNRTIAEMEPAYRANLVARRQLRGLTALTILALRGSEGARRSIARASIKARSDPSSYRADVRAASDRSFRQLQ